MILVTSLLSPAKTARENLAFSMLFGSWVRRLFPEFAQRVNLVSGGNKSRVRVLYAALHEAASQANIRNRFFAVVDKDSAATIEVDTGASMFTWDSYHIENYLIDPGSIREARKHFSWVQTRSTPIPRFLTHFETVLVE